MNLIEKIKRAGWYFTDKDRYNHGDLVNREETKTVDPKATIHLVRPEDAKYFTKRRNLAYTASQELSEGEQKRISEYLDITGSIEGFSRLRILPIDETLFARYMSAIEGLEEPTVRQAHLPRKTEQNSGRYFVLGMGFDSNDFKVNNPRAFPPTNSIGASLSSFDITFML